MQPPRFTTRKLFWLMTTLTNVVAVCSQIVLRAQRRYAQTRLEGHHRGRAFLEENRRYFTPAQYQFQKRKLDEEAASLGIEN